MKSLAIRRRVDREDILSMEEFLKNTEGAMIGDNNTCPLTHTFADGMYVREIFIPAGLFVVGKIHKHSHPNFLLKGTVMVVTEFGSERLIGPVSIISKAGTKRALYAITDLTWVTVHLNPTNTQDLAELEEEIIAPSYEAYEQFILEKNQTKNIL